MFFGDAFCCGPDSGGSGPMAGAAPNGGAPGTIGGTNGTAEGDKPRGLLAMRGNQSCSAHSRETQSLGEVPAVSPR